MTAILFGLFGFVAGILVNLLADYLPARRHAYLARTSPFASRDEVVSRPHLLPDRPPLLWSGLVALLTRRHIPRRTRWAAVELLCIGLFVALGLYYGFLPSLPFFLFYAATLILIAVIDIEHRWIMTETLIPLAAAALLEGLLGLRVPMDEVLRGALLALAATTGLWLLGIGFGRLMHLIRGRAVGRTIFGFGDVLLATAGGLILGVQGIGLALILMMLSGGVAAALLVIGKRLRRTKRGRRRPLAIPYGPHIVIGIFGMLFVPWAVRDLLFALFGLIR